MVRGSSFAFWTAHLVEVVVIPVVVRCCHNRVIVAHILRRLIKIRAESVIVSLNESKKAERWVTVGLHIGVR